MKKMIFLILALLTVLTLAACSSGGSSGEQEETKSGTVNYGYEPTEADLDDSMFAYPGDRRQAVVDYMTEMATIEWIPTRTFMLEGQYQHWKYNLVYDHGTTYYGLPFSGNMRGTLQQFKNFIDEKKNYVGDMTNVGAVGNVCYDAVYASLVQVCPSVNYKDTSDLFPVGNTGIVPLGEWDGKSAHDSLEVIENTPIGDMAQYYALLDIGDLTAKHSIKSDAGHMRIVVEKPTVVYTSSGSINYDQSKVTTVEQTNAWDQTTAERTTWWVRHEYSFSKLYEDKFVPMTVEDYAKDADVKAKVYCSPTTDADALASAKKLKGIVYSNYNLMSVSCTITGPDGKEVMKTIDFPNVKRYHLSSLDFDLDYSSLAKGKYHFSVDVEIGIGKKTLAQYDFEVK